MMTVKIALLGFGTVASGLPFLLKENADKIFATATQPISISKILVRSEEDKERLLAEGYDYEFVTSIDAILSDDSIAIVVELMGRIEPAKTYIKRALEAGKHVVSANKDLIAVHGTELLATAEQNGVSFYYEAAVAGGIPILRTLVNALAADKMTRVLGVLNGTSNFMMTKMVEEGWSYEGALARAQELGYAESDPTNDVEGIDAAYKAVILSQFAFGMTLPFENVHHQGITDISPSDVETAQKFGYVIKLLGDIRETPSGISAEVVPTFVPNHHPLANVNDVMNAVYVESIGIGQSMYYGPGAGQKPTAVSVMADIIRIVKRLSDGTVGKPFNDFKRPLRLAKPEDIVNKYYVALDAVNDKQLYKQLQGLVEQFGGGLDELLYQDAHEERVRVVMIISHLNQTSLAAFKDQLSTIGDMRLQKVFKVLGE